MLQPEDPDSYYRDARTACPPTCCRRHRQGQDRHHQLPRLQAPRDDGDRPRSAALCCKAAASRPRRSRPRARCCSAPAATCWSSRTSSSSTTRRITAIARSPQSDEEDGPQGRGEGRGEEEQRGGAAVDFRHRGAEAQAWRSRAVYDLSATPFFLRGSGYREGTLFPWAVSDFSLMDAIECGIVKLPRVPGRRQPAVRRHADLSRPLAGAEGAASAACPRRARQVRRTRPAQASARASDRALCPLLAITSRHSSNGTRRHRRAAGVHRRVQQHRASRNWSTNGFPASSATNEDGEPYTVHQGHLELFRNYDEHGKRLPQPEHAADRQRAARIRRSARPALSRNGRPRDRAVQAREDAAREGAGAGAETISDADLLREVMNTVGKRRPAGRGHPLRRLGLDADRGLGHQHRHPYPRRARLRHAACCASRWSAARCAGSPTS